MENTIMYSPDSVDSVEFLHYQNDYERNIFDGFDMGLDDNDDCGDLNLASEPMDPIGFNQAHFVSNSNSGNCSSSNDSSVPANDPNSQLTSKSKLFRLNQGNSRTLNVNTALNLNDVSSSFEMDVGMSPLGFIAKEESNRKRYPVGDSNSKNAIAARDNRIKKKKYVAQLEDRVKILRTDNKALSKEVVDSKKRIGDLESEVHYLKSVIANQSTLSAILNSVTKTPGISLSTSFNNNSGEEVIRVEDKRRVHASTSDINSLKERQCISKYNAGERNLRSQSNLRSKSLTCKAKGVQNMTAEEIVQCCKEKKRKVISESGDSETDSEVEEIDVDDSLCKIKNSAHLQEAEEEYGGICLHVSAPLETNLMDKWFCDILQSCVIDPLIQNIMVMPCQGVYFQL